MDLPQNPSPQWYPGHIAKYERQLSSLLKLVDVVVEVLDARLPLASTNPRLENQIRCKPTLVVLNKSDLADPRQNTLWRQQLTFGEQRAILYQAKQSANKSARPGKTGKALLLDEILTLGESAWRRLESRGRKRRPLRVLVAGMPNVGKSTLINSIVQRKKVKTGHRAGVTRETQWVRIHPDIELMDTPGIIPPRLESNDAGALLSCVSSIGDAAFEDEAVATFLLERIQTLYPGIVNTYYKLDEQTPLSLPNIAEARHFRLPGDQLDTLRTAQAILTDFRHGRLGRLSLEHAPRKLANRQTENAGKEPPDEHVEQTE